MLQIHYHFIRWYVIMKNHSYTTLTYDLDNLFCIRKVKEYVMSDIFRYAQQMTTTRLGTQNMINPVFRY